MHQGHHGANHPVKDHTTGKVEIVSMNHGFAVDSASLPEGVEETHVSLFDGSNCGIALTGRPVFSVQHHPEASPGPQDRTICSAVSPTWSANGRANRRWPSGKKSAEAFLTKRLRFARPYTLRGRSIWYDVPASSVTGVVNTAMALRKRLGPEGKNFRSRLMPVLPLLRCSVGVARHLARRCLGAPGAVATTRIPRSATFSGKACSERIHPGIGDPCSGRAWRSSRHSRSPLPRSGAIQSGTTAVKRREQRPPKPRRTRPRTLPAFQIGADARGRSAPRPCAKPGHPACVDVRRRYLVIPKLTFPGRTEWVSEFCLGA